MPGHRERRRRESWAAAPLLRFRMARASAGERLLEQKLVDR